MTDTMNFKQALKKESKSALRFLWSVIKGVGYVLFYALCGYAILCGVIGAAMGLVLIPPLFL